jgi:uncharacterized coiled-coil DUF342 family protein
MKGRAEAAEQKLSEEVRVVEKLRNDLSVAHERIRDFAQNAQDWENQVAQYKESAWKYARRINTMTGDIKQRDTAIQGLKAKLYDMMVEKEAEK